MADEVAENVAAVPNQMSLALERTFLAHERTLMAWTRTSTSLITFGFTLYKFFEYLHERGDGVGHQPLFGARTFGMLMIGIGVFTLIAASVQHRVLVGRLKVHYPAAPISLAFLLASLIALLGCLGFLSGLLPHESH